MDKKTELMRQAIRLFAEKGYHQTTILEIAQAAGISKGAFYHHFESKESMLIAILKHNYEEMIKRANAPIEKQGLSKKDIFMKKLSNELEQWMLNREFFSVLFRDFPRNENKQIAQLMRRYRLSLRDTHQNNLLAAFGEEIRPHIYDIVTIFEGILKEFVIEILFNQKYVFVERLAVLITTSMDSIIRSLDQLEPVFAETASDRNQTDVKEDLISHLGAMEKIIVKLPCSVSRRDKLRASIRLLAKEMDNEQPELFLLEAMVTYLKQEKALTEEMIVVERYLEYLTRQLE